MRICTNANYIIDHVRSTAHITIKVHSGDLMCISINLVDKTDASEVELALFCISSMGQASKMLDPTFP